MITTTQKALAMALAGALCLGCSADRICLLRSTAGLEARLQERFAKGTPRSEIEQRFAETGVGLRPVGHDQMGPRASPATCCSSHLEARLGTYRLAFRVDVVAILGFDDRDRLCELVVRKFKDAL